MSDRLSSHQDRPWRAAGIGMSASRLRMGCNTAKSQIGSAGQGVRWRCAACLAAKAEKKAVAAA